jgi:hypothetical protein
MHAGLRTLPGRQPNASQFVGGFDREITASAERLDGFQAAHGGAAHNPFDRVIAELDEQAVGLPPAGVDKGRNVSGPRQICLSPAWA